mmetsp:Transcript_29528/g.68312  ORF Transcript_29528/g.68312 Transcript_29528/m.68312 type:complete len:204 (+) Transcript_29528:799-1410(+)
MFEGTNESFCLWNGLVGAAPGHPFLARIVERVVTLVSNRADAFDIEMEMCHSVGVSADAWKLRLSPISLLSGPCALGVGVNDGLSNNNRMSHFDLGWLSTSEVESSGLKSDDHDALLLKIDKTDMGALRFTDLDRNILVASTDMVDLTKTPLDEVSSTTSSLRAGRRYNNTEFLTVYTDDLASNEKITLQLVVSSKQEGNPTD